MVTRGDRRSQKVEASPETSTVSLVGLCMVLWILILPLVPCTVPSTGAEAITTPNVMLAISCDEYLQPPVISHVFNILRNSLITPGFEVQYAVTCILPEIDSGFESRV